MIECSGGSGDWVSKVVWGSGIRWGIPALLLAIFAGLALASLADEAPTIDELDHLAAGYTYLRTGDFRFGRDHPPLMKMLAAAPLLLLELAPVEGSPGWEARERPRFNTGFFLHNWAAPRRMLFLGRLPIIAVGILTGLVVFLWGRELWGYWPGVFVLFLYAFCPNILAHTRLVTTDAGVASFTLLTLFTLWHYRRSGRLRWAAGCGVALGAALLAKYSAIVTAALAPALILIPPFDEGGSGRIFRRLPPGSEEIPRCPPPSNGRSRGLRGRPAWLGLAVILAFAAATITIGYGSPRGLAQYYQGIQEVQARFRPGARAKWSFLWGEHSRTGFWNYYLLAQLWKTPVPTLLFFGWGLVVIVRDRSLWFDAAFLLLPIVAFHAAGMLNDVNIGIRHLLPVYPFVFLICGAAAWRLFERRARSSPRDRGVRSWQRLMPIAGVTVLCGWYAFGTLHASPYFLSYFNELVGGPDNGIYYLDDSNIDWGQDMFRLKRYLDERHLDRVRCAVFAPLKPDEYGIEADPIGLRDLVWPRTGVTYCVSADYLQRPWLYKKKKATVRFEWLQRYRPVDKVGWSIFVYRFSTDPAAVADSAVFYIPRAQWYADAIAALRAIRVQMPEFAEARVLLAEVEMKQARWAARRGKGERADGM